LAATLAAHVCDKAPVVVADDTAAAHVTRYNADGCAPCLRCYWLCVAF
jgi:hypothetical protein